MNMNDSDFINLKTNLQMLLAQSVPQSTEPERVANALVNDQKYFVMILKKNNNLKNNSFTFF